MRDPLSKAERSALMARVRATGNRSTEGICEDTLILAGIKGWVKHPSEILGRPDFYFAGRKVAVFVDGCFWHGCPICQRRIPTRRRKFWVTKISRNRERDSRVGRKLRAKGYKTVRIWEHELRTRSWLSRLSLALQRKRPMRSKLAKKADEKCR
jgi:DNA mismatch endonuclease (patch repair protein)